ncbi:kinase-like protein [Laetiporus sulphureus 93-53]|uniref:Kinase-like protein n=1 Tax=Laetiporus sulphureus 93-53 TaxID=1314785 RepID=A0A165CF30_9APHY|nr:kinase-like protein [Laetiporus sulphureus 93-53]KZT02698.1 kinase-like protein [Laetiporus sulphureus 93-53]
MVGDGSFGTVWLCDWHGTLPPNTPMSAMQCGAGARPEYARKRLVAVKRMKKRWEGGWDECKKLKELESLRAIPYHENIIPLYDFFLLPTTKELYFVFESMEGNLYQLIKARRGKPLAGGLVCSIFQQVVSGLHHIHSHGYFHRDMKPENLLVTTTGLYDYRALSSIASPNVPVERDVVAIVKLADFGLARETKSKPPYTEYVSTRWYRAPEVLLKSRDYSNPVDMWALGTIMAELVNLRPLFPGQNELEQLMRICELLGDPCQDYGPDERGKPIGGGRWSRGVKMARGVGFEFRKMEPQNFYALFDRSVPVELVECIADLLKYDPDARLTSRQCLEHPYLRKFAPLNNPPKPSAQASQTSGTVQPVSTKQSLRNGSVWSTSLQSIAPRHLPPSHSYTSVSQKPEFQPSAPPVNAHIPDASSSHRSSFYDTSSARPRAISDTSSRTSDYGGEPLNPIRVVGVSPQIADSAYASSVYSITGADRVTHSLYAGSGQSDWDAMDVSPHVEVPEQYIVADNQSTEIQTSPMAREYPSRPVQPEPIQDHSHADAHDAHHSHGHKLAKLPFGFGKKHSKWGLGMFGHGDKSSHTLPPVQEVNVSSANSTPSLKRTQTSSTDSRSLSELSPISEAPTNTIMDAKTRKKEAERIVREAEKQRREHARKKHRDQARAVMEKQKLALTHEAAVLDWQWLSAQNSQIGAPPAFRDKGKQPMAMGPIRQSQSHGMSSKTAKASGSVYSPSEGSSARADWRRDERVSKARRREFDDDHSMSSTDLPSGMSVISFATVDSDPGPARSRHRMSSSVCSGGDRVGRMTSLNSLRTCMDEYSLPGRSSASLSLEQQLVNEFHIRASVDSSSLSDGTSSPPPPPMHMLSLSSPPWQQSCDLSSNASTLDSTSTLSRLQDRMSLSLHPSVRHPVLPGGQSYGRPPSPGVAPKSAINPMFKVPPLQRLDRPGSLPPFSQLEAVADGEYPPLSPMSFTSPDEMSNDEI